MDCAQRCSLQYPECAERLSLNPAFRVLCGLILLHFLFAMLPQVMYYSVPALMREMWADKELREKVIWIYLNNQQITSTHLDPVWLSQLK